MILSVLALFGLVVPALPAGAATGPYCVQSLSTQKSACFQTEGASEQYLAQSAEIPLVAVYNWINYSQDNRGGYKIFTGPHACTTTTEDVDYSIHDDLGWWVYPNSGITINNTISSVSTYVNPKCDIKLYDGFSQNGASSEWIDRCTNLGGSGQGDCPAGNWYDRASSFELS